ncbi:hemolysin III family protein [Alicyclobacillus curvatus]|nr:hemolysin III family protein [Alicyclobacillus curvatus]
MYTCSTLLHALPRGRAKDVFEILDPSSIYLFIAGAYTPLLLLLVKGWVAWTLFAILWGIAAVGIVFKVFLVKRFVLLSTVGSILRDGR